MHIGIELEGSMHLGKQLLFVTNAEISQMDAETIIDIAAKNKCEGVYFGADLTFVDEQSYDKIEQICKEMPSTIELPISNRGEWIEGYKGVRGEKGLHVIHRLDDMHGYPLGERSIIDSDDVKIYSPSTGQVITWRHSDATKAVYPRDYGGDRRV